MYVCMYICIYTYDIYLFKMVIFHSFLNVCRLIFIQSMCFHGKILPTNCSRKNCREQNQWEADF